MHPRQHGQACLKAKGSAWCQPSYAILHILVLYSMSPVFEGFFLEPQAELNTAFPPTDSVIRDEWNHRIVSKVLWKALSACWAHEHQEMETQSGLPGLEEECSWSRYREHISIESTGPVAEKISDYLTPGGCSPMCHFAKAVCFVETNTFWLLLGSVHPEKKPSWIPFYLMIHPPICQLNSGWGHFVVGEGGTELKWSMLVLRSQAICSVIRNTMFCLRSWSYLIRVSARQDKHWPSWCKLISS